jgi:hypothetical protein
MSETAGEDEAQHVSWMLEAHAQCNDRAHGDTDEVHAAGALANRGVHGLDGSIQREWAYLVAVAR